MKGDKGCSEFELHNFRRTCITTWLRSTIAPRTVMACVGRSDRETALRYPMPGAAPERIPEATEIKWY